MVDKKKLLEAVQKARALTKQRKFTESFELIINFKGLNFKKQENQIDVKAVLPNATGKAANKVLVFAKDKQFISDLEGKVTRVIPESDISLLDKKQISEIVNEFDVFLAEGSVMLTVGKYMGQVLAPKGKMPKPVQPNAASVQSMLSSTKSETRISNRKGKFMPLVQVLIGSEKLSDEQLADNISAAFEAVLAVLPGKKYNIKSVYIKKTMGKPLRVDEIL